MGSHVASAAAAAAKMNRQTPASGKHLPRSVAALLALLLALPADAACPQNSDADCAAAEAQAKALVEKTEAARRAGDTEGVLATEQARLSLAIEHGLLQHESEARTNLALIDLARGEIQSAANGLDAALDGFRRVGDVGGEARVHSELSRLERRRGDYLAALRYELSGLELRRRLNPPHEIGRSLLNLALLYEQIELFDEAHEYYAQALAEAERGGEPNQIGDVLNGYAGFLNDFGRDSAARALPMAKRALEIHRTRGDSARIGSCLLQVARAQLGLGQIEAAEAAVSEALALAEQGGFEALRAHIEFRWGELEFARGNHALALERIERARAEYARQDNRHRLIKVYGSLERVHAALGDTVAAVRAGREHFRLRSELLGANATSKLGEILTNFALAEERHRSELLRQENAVNVVRLESERRLRLAGYLIAAIVIAALLLLVWRHATVRQLYRLLSEKNAALQSQGEALAEANAQLVQSNRTDTLTGLATRAHGIHFLSDALARARERGTSPALLLLDLDLFKDINDRYGHLAGDQVLIAVAAVLAELTPREGMAARVGGEEFILVLEHAERARAEVLADALRRRVRDLSIDVGPRCIGVTVSTGIAHAGAGLESVRELFSAADKALYAAKHAGRDCVRTHSY